MLPSHKNKDAHVLRSDTVDVYDDMAGMTQSTELGIAPLALAMNRIAI